MAVGEIEPYPEPEPQRHIDKEIARFDAWVTRHTSGPLGTYRIEFTLPSDFKDEWFACLNEQGLVLTVVVYDKVYLGEPPFRLPSEAARGWEIDGHEPALEDV